MKVKMLSLLAGLVLLIMVAQPAFARSYEQRARDITVEVGYVIDAMLEARPVDHGALKELRGELERLHGELAVDGHENNRVQACWEMLNILVKDTARFDGMSDTDRVSYLGWVRITMDSVWQRFKQGELSDYSDLSALLPHGGGGMGGKRMQEMPAQGGGTISSEAQPAATDWKLLEDIKPRVTADTYFEGWEEGAHFTVSLEGGNCIATINNGSWTAEWRLPAPDPRRASIELDAEDNSKVIVSIGFADGSALRYMIANGGSGPIYIEK